MSSQSATLNHVKVESTSNKIPTAARERKLESSAALMAMVRAHLKQAMFFERLAIGGGRCDIEAFLGMSNHRSHHVTEAMPKSARSTEVPEKAAE